MNDQMPVYAMAVIIIGFFLSDLLRGKFDPFAPVWLFLVGFAHVYILQALSYREYALRTRGQVLVTEANIRALWALALFLFMYLSPIGRTIASYLPRAPAVWSTPLALGLSPLFIGWGLFCALIFMQLGDAESSFYEEPGYLVRFPILLLTSGVMLIVSGQSGTRSRPVLTFAGLLVAGLYVMIWMFNGRRSHALFGVLATVCAYYSAKGKRPSLPVLAVTGLAGAMAVTLALGWRNNTAYSRTPSGFLEFMGDFKASDILVNLNMNDPGADTLISDAPISYETTEVGAFLLMMDTVPAKADYDYGESYLRIVTTFIPRPLWPNKPIHGRDQWIAAWQAGSEFTRDSYFTGPAIGILGATQLNGGAVATFVIMGGLAVGLRTAYEYYRLYSHTGWAQVWWSLTYFNAWLMTVNDDPFVWFYYVYGYSVLPPMLFLWWANRSMERGQVSSGPALGGLSG